MRLLRVLLLNCFALLASAQVFLPPGTFPPVLNTIRNGFGAPANTLGNNGDFYIDPTALRLYGPKASGAWPASVSLGGGAGGGGYVYGPPTGTINGTNLVFTLPAAPNPANSLILADNGFVLEQGLDYTLAGSTVTFIDGAEPLTGDILQAWYAATSAPGGGLCTPATALISGCVIVPSSGGLTVDGSGNLSLATANSGPGLCGDATHVCQITTNGFGLITLQAPVSVTASAAWGAITGTLSSQTDLNSALGGKQATGNYLTALTGDVTASGPGSSAGTLATVNSGPGNCGDATHVCQVTTNGKGLTTAQSAVSIGTLNQNTTGNAATATALAATPSQAASNQYCTGITAAGSCNSAQVALSQLSGASNVVQTNQANSYTAGDKQTFAASSTTAGETFAGVASDPSSLFTGDRWYNTTSKHPKIYDGTTAQTYMFQSDTLGSGQLPALSSAKIWIGNGSSTAVADSMSGDCGLSNAGAITCTQLNGSNFAVSAGGVPTTVAGLTTAGNGVPMIIYRPAGASYNASTTNVTMYSPSAAGWYRASFYATQTDNGVGCTGNATVAFYVAFNDGATSNIVSAEQALTGTTANPLTQLTLSFSATTSAWGQASDKGYTFYAGSGSEHIVYATVYTNGTGCSTQPHFEFFPILEQF